MNKYFLVFVLLVGSLICEAQETDIGAIHQKLEKSTDSFERVYLYRQLVDLLKTSDLERAIEYNKKALSLSNTLGSDIEMALTNQKMGELFEDNRNIQPAINYYLISANLFRKVGDREKLARIYSSLGHLYFDNEYDLELANHYFQLALDYAIQLNDKELIGLVYNRIGEIFYNQENFVEAGHFYTKAYQIWHEIDSKVNEARVLNNLGEIQSGQGNFNQAMNYYKQSLKLNQQLGNEKEMAKNYMNIGLIYSDQGNSDNAFKYYNLSLDHFLSVEDLPNQIEIYILIGQEFLAAGEFDQALKSFQLAFEKAQLINDWLYISKSAYGISNVLEQDENFNDALKYFKIYASYNDSITNKQKIDQLTEIQVRFLNDLTDKELQLKDNNILLLETEKRINLFQRNLLIMMICLVIVFAVYVIFRFRQQVRRQKLIHEKDAELHRAQKELMEIEINSKDNDLMNYALHLVQKNKMLKQIQRDLRNMPESNDTEINRRLKELSLQIKQSLHIQKDVEEFQTKVDETYYDFFKKIKTRFPNLTRNEERLCALLRLNLSSKEIAVLNNTSLKAVEMSRYRLRKKCQLENTDLLPQYLQSL